MKEASSSRRVLVDIFGHQYNIKTDGDEDHVRRVAEFVVNRAREVMESTQTVSTVDVFIKVALSLADELLQERTLASAFKEKMAREASELVRQIDSHLKEISKGS